MDEPTMVPRRVRSHVLRLAAVGVLLLAVVALAAALVVPRLQGRLGAAALEARLRGLEGRTGLDPLDPARPLASADVLKVGAPGPGEGWERVADVRFTYADGASRVYRVGLSQRLAPFGGWRYSTLDPAFAPHLELPGLPAAGLDAPLRVGTPAPLAADGLPPLPPASGHDLEVLFRAPGPLWSPGGDALLVPAAEPGSPGTGLWLVPVGGAPARLLAPGAEAAAWSPDGRFVVYRGWDAGGGRTLATVGRDGALGWSLRLDGNPPPPFVVVEGAALFARGGALWRMPLGAAPGSAPTRLRELPGVRLESWLGEPPPIAADRIGGLVAYACGPDLCLAGVDRRAPTRVALGEPPPALTLTPVPAWPTPVGPPPAPAAKAIPDFDPTAAGWPVLRAAWSPDGRRLAAVWSDRQPSELGRRPRLAIIDRSGGVLAQLDVGPNGPVDAPFWMPDGRFLLLRAYPENGRRIVVVEVATGRVFDLSQPGWDALFSLSPDGTRLLLANGRGGFWVAPVERRQP